MLALPLLSKQSFGACAFPHRAVFFQEGLLVQNTAVTALGNAYSLALSTCRLAVRRAAIGAGKHGSVRICRSKTQVPFKPEENGLDDAGPHGLFLPTSLKECEEGRCGTHHHPAIVGDGARSGVSMGKGGGCALHTCDRSTGRHSAHDSSCPCADRSHPSFTAF